MADRETDKAVVLRVLSVGGTKQVDGSRALALDPFGQVGAYAGTAGRRRLIVPPLGEGTFSMLVDVADESNILGQCVDAYEVNIDGFGHRFELAVEEDKLPEGQRPAADAEKERLEEFFTYAYHDGSFIELRRRTRQDIETTGVGYWEVLRDRSGQIVRLNHLPSHTVRMSPYDPETVTIDEVRRTGLATKTVKLARRFRVYCQIHHAAGKREMVWFKDFGDPRVLDYKTGEFNAKGDKSRAATELICFRTSYHPKTPYALPRWIGNLPSVLGSRAAEEINLLYFDNKTIPPLVITVAGGLLTKGAIKRLQDTLENEIKGRANFHKALILEATAPEEAAAGKGSSKIPRIEVKPLTDKQIQDAMFMGYDEGNRKKVRSSFRLPPLLTGETPDYNRATAEASMLMIEEQVFRPERMGFDFYLNRWIMPQLGATSWKFVSNGPNVTQNQDLIELLGAGESVGAMTPNIGRKIMSDVMEEAVPPIEEPWGDVPFSLTVAESQAQLLEMLGGLDPGAGEGAPPPREGDEAPAEGEPPAGEAPPAKPGQEGDSPAKRAARRMIARRLPVALKQAVLLEARDLLKLELARRRKTQRG